MNFEQAKRKIYNIIGKAINSIAQNEAGNTSDIPKTVTDGAPELICKAGIEGSVLLRNDDVLPFKKTDKISVFGRCQYDWFYVGYGSGGDVIKLQRQVTVFPNRPTDHTTKLQSARKTAVCCH